jgi:hypothetical protein
MARYPLLGFVAFDLAVAMVPNVLGIEAKRTGELLILDIRLLNR